MNRPVDPPVQVQSQRPAQADRRGRDNARAARSLNPMRLLALLVLLVGAFTLGMPVQAADPAIEALRIAQQKQLDALQAEYHAKVRGNPNLVKPDGTIDTSHPDYQKTLSEYVQAKGQIQSTFSGQDPRGKELEAIKKAHGKDVDPTGSAPKDVRADMDITAKTTKTADAISRDLEGERRRRGL